MTSKELIKRVIEYNNPPRLGFDFNPPHAKDIDWVTPCKFINKKYEDKLEWGDYPDIKARVPHFKGQVRYNLFGNIYGRLKNDSNGECIKGALEDDYDMVDTYEMPQIDMEYDKEVEAMDLKNSDKFILGSLPVSAFSTFRDLRLMDNALMDILAEPENTKKLLDKVLDVALEAVDLCAKNGLDGIIIYDDWGMQHATFISPVAFREFFKPMYKAIADKVHGYDMKLFVHSCGLVYEFMEDFIDAGVDVMQFDQPELTGSAVLAKEFGKRIAFHCPVDIQKVMATGDRKYIEETAKEMVDVFKAIGGGLISKDYPTWDSIEIDEQWATWGRDVILDNSNM